ncbi:zinc-binding dehydrogenase [Sanguibacter inulinus]
MSAFDSTRSHLEPRYAAPLREARTPGDIVDVLVEATVGATSPTLDDIRLYAEIRHYGIRNPDVAAVLQAVEDDSLAMLHGRLPKSTGLAVNALLWGWWSHRLAHPDEALDEVTVRRSFEGLLAVPALDPPSPRPPRRSRPMPDTMRAIRLTGPVDIDDLPITDVPVPEVRPGWVRLRVRAFGVNESEVTSRQGESGPDFSFPRVLGIEAVGVVDAVGAGVDLAPGQKVATMMGGLGRTIDGSYAEYTVVDAANVIPFDTALGWDVVGSLPEMLQTAHGVLITGLALQAGQSVLIHGATSTVGLTAVAVAHQLGATVFATTRNPARAELLTGVGADHVLVDDETLPEAIRAIAPDGLDAALELVGAPALPATLSVTRSGGTVCFVGALSGSWTIPDFDPFTIPTGVHLTSYAGEATDLPADALGRYLQAIEAGTLNIVIAGTFEGLEKVADAHRNLESRHQPGKYVVVLPTS